MDVKEFLNKSYTAYHAVKYGAEMLEKAGFKKLDMKDVWRLEKNVGYYVIENGTSLFAFKAGENHVFNVVESHTDSPSLKVKGNKLIDSAEGKRLNVEKYGGLLLYSFLDAPLKVAGRIAYSDGGEVKTDVVESKYTVVIPSLAIHHNPRREHETCVVGAKRYAASFRRRERRVFHAHRQRRYRRRPFRGAGDKRVFRRRRRRVFVRAET